MPEIEHLVKKLAGIATFFHASAKRTSDLEKVGAKENLTVHRIPKYFEIRWSEFTAALLDAVLCSWQALVKFCEEQHGTEEKKFLKLLTNKDNILMMCFVADLLFLLKVFQKKLQRDSLTIVDIEPEAETFQKSIDKLSTSPLLGGWEEAFKERFNEEENTFCNTELWEKKRRNPEANLYVIDRREFSAIQNESILALKEFMDIRLQVDKNVSKSFTPFTKFTANENEIRDIHRSIAPDLSLADLAVEFQELQQCNELPKTNPHTVLQNIVNGGNEQYYRNVSVVLGRILVCKPHSADCERVISLYNKVKSICRSSLKRQTMSDYLYINMNMPPLYVVLIQDLQLFNGWMKENTGQGTLQKRESKNGSAKFSSKTTALKMGKLKKGLRRSK